MARKSVGRAGREESIEGMGDGGKWGYDILDLTNICPGGMATSELFASSLRKPRLLRGTILFRWGWDLGSGGAI